MRFRSLLTLALGLPFAGCVSYRVVTLQEVRSVDVHECTDNGVAFTVQAVIDNPNGYRITAQDPDVDLYLEGAPIGKAVLDSTITLDKRSLKTYRVPMHAHFDGGIPLVSLMLARLLDPQRSELDPADNINVIDARRVAQFDPFGNYVRGLALPPEFLPNNLSIAGDTLLLSDTATIHLYSTTARQWIDMLPLEHPAAAVLLRNGIFVAAHGTRCGVYRRE